MLDSVEGPPENRLEDEDENEGLLDAGSELLPSECWSLRAGNG